MYYMRIQLYPNVVSKYVLNTPLLVYSQSDTTIYMYSVVYMYSVCIVQVYQNAIHVSNWVREYNVSLHVFRRVSARIVTYSHTRTGYTIDTL